MKKGDKVVVNDPGLLMLQQFAPKGAKPNNVGWVDSVKGNTVFVLFPIGDADPKDHSQLAPYPKSLVELKNW